MLKLSQNRLKRCSVLDELRRLFHHWRTLEIRGVVKSDGNPASFEILLYLLIQFGFQFMVSSQVDCDLLCLLTAFLDRFDDILDSFLREVAIIKIQLHTDQVPHFQQAHCKVVG